MRKNIITWLGILILLLGLANQVQSTGIATSGYRLEVPLPIASYYIGQFTNGSTFAINGSNWECFKTSTNDSDVFQTVFDACQEKSGEIEIGEGVYYLNYNVSYHENITLKLTGTGSRIASAIASTKGNTVLVFNQSCFLDEGHEPWNSGWTNFIASDIAFVFDAGSVATKGGRWLAKVTLPTFTNVRLALRGNRTDNEECLFGRGTGAVGLTARWENVIMDVQTTDGSDYYCARVNFDTFIWSGGAILTNLGASTYNTRILYLETTMGAIVDSVSVYRDDDYFLTYFTLTANDNDEPYIFRNLQLYGSNGKIVKHFSSSSATWVVLESVIGYYSGSEQTLEMSNVYQTRQYGTTLVANNENVTHGLGAFPTQLQITCLNATYDDVVVIASIDWILTNSTKFNVQVYWTNGTAITDDCIGINWIGEYDP